MYHYTYQIHYSTGCKYIGVRSSNVPPEEDTAYVGSSKVTPNDKILYKEILGSFSTRELALAAEMELHETNNVVKSKLYYNRANQNGTRFDSFGVKQSPEHLKKRIAPHLGAKRSKEFCQQMSKIAKERKRKPHSEATKAKMSKSQSGLPSSLKGRKFTKQVKEEIYTKRLKYPNKIHWYNKKTTEKFFGNPQDLAEKLGVETNMVTRVLDNLVKSYHGWYPVETDQK